MGFMDVLAYSVGASLPWGGIGICVFWILRRFVPVGARWRFLVFAIPPVAGGLGSWTGFEGQSLLFPAITALLWGGVLYLATVMGLQSDREKKE